MYKQLKTDVLRWSFAVNVMRNSVIWSQTKEAVSLIVIQVLLGIVLLSHLNFFKSLLVMEERMRDKAREDLLLD